MLWKEALFFPDHGILQLSLPKPMENTSEDYSDVLNIEEMEEILIKKALKRNIRQYIFSSRRFRTLTCSTLPQNGKIRNLMKTKFYIIQIAILLLGLVLVYWLLTAMNQENGLPLYFSFAFLFYDRFEYP